MYETLKKKSPWLSRLGWVSCAVGTGLPPWHRHERGRTWASSPSTTSHTVCYSSIRASACWHETQEGILDSGRATVLTVTATVPRGRSLCVWSLVHVLSHFSMAEAGLSQSVSHCFRWDFFHFVLAFQVCSSGAMGQPDWWIRITDCFLPYSFITFNFVSKSLDTAF